MDNTSNFEEVWQNHDFQGPCTDGRVSNYNNFIYSSDFLSKLKTICYNINNDFLSKYNANITKITKKDFANSQNDVTFNIYYILDDKECVMQVNCYSESNTTQNYIPDSIAFN